MTAGELQQPEEWLTIEEAARVLRISEWLAYKLAKKGKLPGCMRVGRRWRVSRRALGA